jgi:hypothetical protein
MALKKELQQLREQRCEDGCLTIYLNTDQSSTDQKKGEWKIRLKNGLSKLEEYIQASNDEELASYKKLKKIAFKEIPDMQTTLTRSLVFLGSSTGEWQIKQLNVPVENEFRWEKHPAIEQLEKIQTDFPKVGVLVVQKLDVLAIETSLGEVNQEFTYSWDIDDEDWKEYEGTASTDRTASSATHKDQYDQRFEANQQRWFKQLAQVIQKKAKRAGWDTIYLSGSNEAVAEFEKHLTYRNVKVIHKNFTKAKGHEIIGEVLAS